MSTFADQVAAERSRITKAIADATTRAQLVAKELEGYRLELIKLDAYDNAGKPSSPHGRRSPTTQRAILALLAKHAPGLSSAQLSHAGQVGEGDAKAWASALARMVKKGTLTLADGIYSLP